MAETYTWEEYSGISRRWSVLKLIAAEILVDETSMLFRPAAVESSFYHADWPVGIHNRPVVVFEEPGAVPGDMRLGMTGLQLSFQLTVLMGVFEAGGTRVDACTKLDVWTQRFLKGLHGRRVPFYDFRNPLLPMRIEGMDFELRWRSYGRESEKLDQDKNVLKMGFQSKI